MSHFTTERSRIHSIRLLPDQDLKEEIQRLTTVARIHAGFVITATGSLKRAALRLANRSETTIFEGPFEIVSLAGTLSHDGPHLHVALADGDGRTIGGHLMDGCVIFTTVELVVGEAVGLLFRREVDDATTFKELAIRRAG